LLAISAVRDYIRSRQLDRAEIQASELKLQTANAELLTEIDKQAQQEATIRQESDLLQQDIGELLDVVCAIEEGDFTIQADVNERATGLIGDTLNRLIEELGSTLSQVATAAKRVSVNSNKQREMATLVAQQTEAQANSAKEVLNTTENVRQSASSATTQLGLAKGSLDNLQTVVDRGQTGMDVLGREIDVLEQGSDRIVQQMKTLGEFVGLTEQFVREQAEIATETQILALNAALVAARAAEQRDPNLFAAVSQEFAAIADRVSQLAQATNLGLNNLEEQSSRVNRAVSIVDGDVQRLNGIVSSLTQGVKQTRVLFQTVRSVTLETADSLTASVHTSQAIVAAADVTAQEVAEITNLSQFIATQSQVAESISDRLNDLSAELLTQIEVFKLPVNREIVATPESTPEPSYA
jgi:methyl-accepting chemotaxis protein PixJ